MQRACINNETLAARASRMAGENALLRAVLDDGVAMAALASIPGHASDACRKTLEAMRGVLGLPAQTDGTAWLRALY